MFKVLPLLLFLVLISSAGFAAIYVVEPVDEQVSPEDSSVITFGKIARGETLRVVVKKKSDLPGDWVSLSVDQSLLPQGWVVNSRGEDKTLIAEITVPENAEVSSQRISFIAESPNGAAFNETLRAVVSVHENLLEASFDSLEMEAVMGRSSSFSLVLSNDSIAGHSVRVESTLPGYWFSPEEIALLPHETKTVELAVSPMSYGEKPFSFRVFSLENGREFSFPARLNVRPSLVGMYQASVFGFPFFSPSLLPYYLVNGFLSVFSLN